MAEGTLELEIVTPQGVALKERVEEVIVPGAQGEFGVLAGHLPMLAALQTGLLRYRRGQKLHDVAVGNGFAEVLDDKTLILTDRFTTRDEAKGKVLEVRKRLKEVDHQIERWDGELDDPARMDLVAEEQWLAVKLELIGDPPPPRVLENTLRTDLGALVPPIEEEESAKE